MGGNPCKLEVLPAVPSRRWSGGLRWFVEKDGPACFSSCTAAADSAHNLAQRSHTELQETVQWTRRHLKEDETMLSGVTFLPLFRRSGSGGRFAAPTSLLSSDVYSRSSLRSSVLTALVYRSPRVSRMSGFRERTTCVVRGRTLVKFRLSGMNQLQCDSH